MLHLRWVLKKVLLRYRLELLLGRTTPEGAACGHLLAGDVAREAFKFEMLYKEGKSLPKSIDRSLKSRHHRKIVKLPVNGFNDSKADKLKFVTPLAHAISRRSQDNKKLRDYQLFFKIATIQLHFLKGCGILCPDKIHRLFAPILHCKAKKENRGLTFVGAKQSSKRDLPPWLTVPCNSSTS